MVFSAREKILNNFKSRLLPIKNSDKTLIHEQTFESAIQSPPETTKAAKAEKKVINMLLYQILAFTIHGKI